MSALVAGLHCMHRLILAVAREATVAQLARSFGTSASALVCTRVDNGLDGWMPLLVGLDRDRIVDNGLDGWMPLLVRLETVLAITA